MENIEEILSDRSVTEESLLELKSWLFRENIRLVTAAAELQEKQENLSRRKSSSRRK